MPVYEYRCENGHTFEAMQRMSDDPLTACTVCGAPVQRVFHPVAVHFKGSGFYTTDYGRKKGGRGGASDDGAGSEAGGKKESDGKAGSGAKPDSGGSGSRSSGSESGSSGSESGSSGSGSGSSGSGSGSSSSGSSD
jgi:putative FmdB family regulatory protein